MVVGGNSIRLNGAVERVFVAPVPRGSDDYGRRLAVMLLFAMVVAYPLVYIGMFAGDAVIHLSYAEHAAHGRFFEFNPGDVSPGVTSPGYMLLIAVLFRIFSPYLIPLVVKLLNLAAWYLLVFLVWRIGRRLLTSGTLAALVAIVAGMMPGSVYNATTGMENGLFAVFVFAPIVLTLERSGCIPRRLPMFEGLLWGCAVWLRPEGALAAALWYVVRWEALRGQGAGGEGKRDWWRSVVTFTILAGAVALFQLAETGTIIPSSARSRIWLASFGSYTFGPLRFDPKFTVRLAAYAPITLAAIIGTYAAFAQNARPGSRWCARYLAVLFWLFFVLYSTVLGAAHLARYAIFLMPALCLLAGIGLEHLMAAGFLSGQRLRVGAVVATFMTVGVFAAETLKRRELGGHDALVEAMHAPAKRSATTDELLHRLGNSAEAPVTIAIGEVQLRYFLDDRIKVRSLDGRTDPLFFSFVKPERVEYVGYLRSAGVNFLLAFPNDNRDRTAWAPRALLEMQPGGQVERDGATFRRRGDDLIVAVSYRSVVP